MRRPVAAHVVQQRGGVQLKGGVGEVGDTYERQADEVADAVVRGESAEGLLDTMSAGAGGGAVVQRKGGKGGKSNDSDDAVHNWDNVLAQYNNGSAGSEITDAAEAAGYYNKNTRKAILRAIRTAAGGKWARGKIAHGLGTQDSGKRGGTDKDIQEAKNDIIGWLKANPAPRKPASSRGYASSPRRSADERGSDDRSYREVIQIDALARSAVVDKDEDALNRLIKMATEGNATALRKLERISDKLPRAAKAVAALTTTTTTTTTATGSGCNHCNDNSCPGCNGA